MKPEGSLPHSQEPATYLYPEPDLPSPCHPIPLLKIHFHFSTAFVVKKKPVRVPTKWSLTSQNFCGRAMSAPPPTAKLNDHPLSAILHIWGPFLHSQHENAPCCADMGQPITALYRSRRTIADGCYQHTHRSCLRLLFQLLNAWADFHTTLTVGYSNSFPTTRTVNR